MKFLLDTNIVLQYFRQSPIAERIDQVWNPLAPSHQTQPLVSVVTLGELDSLALQNNWGDRRKQDLRSLLAKFIIVDIRVQAIIRRYAEIDAFSQGRLVGQPLGVSARNMGKNDLWIAASASVLGAKLLTTDADFGHLNPVFLDVAQVTG